ncbi:MAG: 50S ribosomal protein L10 [Clostridia bacterium]|nr:50S ribosomal protein L10 [Clostridia bacterium]
MNANLEAKQAIVEEIKEKIQKAKTVVFVDYRGITVEADTKMRAEIRKSGAEYKVYKNRLVLRALNELGFEGCEKYLEGTNAVAFGYEDEVAPAKIVVNAKSETCPMEVKFGIYNQKVVDANAVKELASIPSKEVLIAKLLSMLTAPARGLAVALNEIAKKSN